MCNHYVELMRAIACHPRLFGVWTISDIRVYMNGYKFGLKSFTNELDELFILEELLNEKLSRIMGMSGEWDKVITFNQRCWQDGIDTFKKFIFSDVVNETLRNMPFVTISSNNFSFETVLKQFSSEEFRLSYQLESVRHIALFTEGMNELILNLKQKGIELELRDIFNNKFVSPEFWLSFHRYACKAHEINRPWNYAKVYDSCYKAPCESIRAMLNDLGNFIQSDYRIANLGIADN